jgi:hypothetical protein
VNCGAVRQRESVGGIVVVFNPEGIVSISPGLRGTSYPGKTSEGNHNLNEVLALCAGW